MGIMFIDPGRLRTELMLEAAVTTADGAGGHTEDWQVVATVFADVEPVGEASRFGAGQAHETVTHRVTLRFREDVASGMRFVRDGRVLDIVTVRDADETGRYLVCRAREEGR
ncbi:phage head closure protein [Chelativorans salis]|uniref:Phage head closure protein n=1 Tax=Chelativorans salis TaxID=2978478 RepID=A0ABT2LNP3_9HYPH|nr:phage head closure protein [Chelativorans sp. EGI FJ00035]MCT7376067.1 phage head closure protein [Chelativorans sp. EGI FJ00035]